MESSSLLVLGCHDTTVTGEFSTFSQNEMSSEAKNMTKKA